MNVTGANTSELFQLEKRLLLMIERLDGVISQGPGFLSRLVNNWLGPLADLFGNTWQHTDLPSINHVRDSLQEIKDILTKNRIEQERASGDRSSEPVQGHGWERTVQPNESSAPPTIVSIDRLEGGLNAKIPGVEVMAGTDGSVELVTLSDGTYLLKLTRGQSASLGVPGIGVSAGNAASVTLRLTPEELKLLSLDGLLLPDHIDASLEGTSADGVSFDIEDRVVAVELTGNVKGTLDGLGVPKSAQQQLGDGIKNPLNGIDSIDGEVQVEHGAELRRTDDGGWEVAYKVSYGIETDLVTETGTPGGWFGDQYDRFTPVDLNNVSVESSLHETQHEVVYDIDSGEFHRTETNTTRTGTSTGNNIGIDTPIIDELGWGSSKELGRADSGDFSSTTTTKRTDLAGNQVGPTTTIESTGETASADLDLIVANGGGSAESEFFTDPVPSYSGGKGFD